MISIILPIYNAQNYLHDCLCSIALQTYDNFEVICVNDGSTDESEHICQKFVSNDKRFILINQKNGGVSSARNRALEVVKGDYICFVDSDDVLDKDYLLSMIKLCDRCDLPIIGYTRDIESLGKNETKLLNYSANTYIQSIINEQVIHPQIVCMLFKMDVVREKNLTFTLGCYRNEDAEFFIKYMSYCTSIIVSDFKGYFYRDNINSAVHIFNLKSLTYIEASERIFIFLYKKGIINNNCPIVAASVQYFVYHLAKQNNKELYDYLHQKYDVYRIMKEMITFSRFSRRIVAYVYLLLGKKNFFRLLSKLV